MLKLEEKRLITPLIKFPEQLPASGKTGQVREFLLKMEENRYAGGEGVDLDELKNKAEELFKEM